MEKGGFVFTEASIWERGPKFSLSPRPPHLLSAEARLESSDLGLLHHLTEGT